MGITGWDDWREDSTFGILVLLKDLSTKVLSILNFPDINFGCSFYERWMVEAEL